MDNITNTITALKPTFGMPTTGSAARTAAACAAVGPWHAQAFVGANIVGANAAVERGYTGTPVWRLLTS